MKKKIVFIIIITILSSANLLGQKYRLSYIPNEGVRINGKAIHPGGENNQSYTYDDIIEIAEWIDCFVFPIDSEEDGEWVSACCCERDGIKIGEVFSSRKSLHRYRKHKKIEGKRKPLTQQTVLFKGGEKQKEFYACLGNRPTRNDLARFDAVNGIYETTSSLELSIINDTLFGINNSNHEWYVVTYITQGEQDIVRLPTMAVIEPGGAKGMICKVNRFYHDALVFFCEEKNERWDCLDYQKTIKCKKVVLNKQK